VHVPQDRWLGNETEKRSFLFRLGHALAVPGEDWLVVADADEVWEPAGSLRSELEGAEGTWARCSCTNRTVLRAPA
jgi:hypothetical protein